MPKVSQLAFKVANLGPAEFGVYHETTGAIAKRFTDRKEAEEYAESRRTDFLKTNAGAAWGQANGFRSANPSPQSDSRKSKFEISSRPGVDLSDLSDPADAIKSVGSTASVASDAFDKLASSAEDLVKDFADVHKFMASDPSSPVRSANTSPFTPGSSGFKAQVSAMAQAFRAAFKSPAGGVPLGGYAANVGAGAGQVAAGVNARVGSGFRNAAKRARVGARFARMAAAKYKFNPRTPIRSAIGRAGAQAKGFASGFGGKAGASGFQAASLTVAAAIEVGKALFDLSRIAFSAVGSMRGFAENALQANQRFANVNVPIAYAFGKLMIDNLHREIGMGKAVQETAVNLAASTNAMRESFKGWDAFLINSENRIGSAFAAGASEVGKSLSNIGNLADNAIKQADPTGTFLPALVASLAAGIMQAGAESANAMAAIVGQNWMPVGGAGARMAAAQNQAAQDAAQAIIDRDKWGQGANASLLGWVAQGPIRGPRRMPQ